MTNIEMIIQIKSIENIINNNSESELPNKTALEFEVSSYSKKAGFYPEKLKKEKNTLLTFGKMSDFAVTYIEENDYILVKGDLREVSENQNIFLPLVIQKITEKNKKIKIKA